MCGIFGVVSGSVDAPNQVFKGLSDIEYRGYDSWGIASFKGNFQVVKKTGFLPKKLTLPKSNLSLGHTRWATHGGVTVANAHPHLDCTGKLALVHNGIFENYLELKAKLGKHSFKSQTDTEVIVHLIEEQLKKTKDLKTAVETTFRKLKGFNAIVVSDGSQIVAAKNGSPIVVGKLKDGFAIASDPNALLPYTRDLIFLEDNQMVVLGRGFQLLNVLTGEVLKPKFTTVNWDYRSGDLKKYPHFMLKEIDEQPLVLSNIARNAREVERTVREIKKSFGTYFVGCGSASYACLAGTYLFSKVAKRHVNFSIGSEFTYIQDFLKPQSCLIAVSQSGETMDVMEPVNNAKLKGTKIIALTNTLGSSLYRMADSSLLLQAGIEKAVAATKSFVAMLANMVLLSYLLAGDLSAGQEVLEKSATEIKKIFRRKLEIKKLAGKIAKARHIYILGRGLSYPIALETSLKIKECAYVHAEGFAGGELKHGVIALIEKGTPVIVYIPNDETKDSILASAMEVKARGAYVIGVGVEDSKAFDYFFEVSDVGASSIIPHTVFAQLLAYYIAIKCKLNPDKPRNLAKSVVVK